MRTHRQKRTSLVERTVDFEHGEHAVTHYKTLAATQLREDNTHSLVWLKLETGRTHQIRVHMKYLGFPLIGDYLYNPDMEYINARHFIPGVSLPQSHHREKHVLYRTAAKRYGGFIS